MDFGSLSRLPHPVGSAVTASPSGPARAGAVGTDLPAAKAVTSGEAGDALRLDLRSPSQTPAPPAPAPERPERPFAVEPVVRPVVLHGLDPATGEAVPRIPDEALLRLRILMREVVDRLRQDRAGEPRIVRRI